MSWKNKLENTRFTIKTGDGKTFNPLWKSGEKSKDYNFEKYDFINLQGSLIKRKQAQSSSYPLVFWFAGDDNIERANEFDISAADSRPWTITHPFYGTIKGHPTNLKRDDNFYGNTQIEVDFWESIDDNYPIQQDSISDVVREKYDALNLQSKANYVNNAKPETSDIFEIKSNVEISGSKFEPDAESFNDYKQAVQKALKDTDGLVAKTSIAIDSIQQVFTLPSLFTRDIRNKIEAIKNAYDELKQLLDFDNRQSKYYFETQGATLIGGLAQSAVNPNQNDYLIRRDVEDTNNELLNLYADYLQNLDDAQVEIENIEQAYSPNVEVQQQLNDLVSYTSQTLFVLSFDARQERRFIVDKDTNLVVLTHRFLGLDVNDENLETFKRINNIKLNEIFTVKKDREIRYYV